MSGYGGERLRPQLAVDHTKGMVKKNPFVDGQ